MIQSRASSVVRVAGYGITAIGTFALGFLATSEFEVIRNIDVGARAEPSESYSPQSGFREGRELVMIYFGALSCAPSNHPDLPEAVESIKLRLKEIASADGASFSAVGIALDDRAEQGLKYLKKFGEFDEISSGRAWANALALDYMWGDVPVSAITPQIAVYRRILHSPRTNPRRPRFAATNAEFITAAAGTEEIMEWSANGREDAVIVGLLSQK